MNLGGEPEKGSIRAIWCRPYSKRRSPGKLDPVIGRDAEIHRTIQISVQTYEEQPSLDRRGRYRQDCYTRRD